LLGGAIEAGAPGSLVFKKLVKRKKQLRQSSRSGKFKLLSNRDGKFANLSVLSPNNVSKMKHNIQSVN
jgi:hypothetical protein